MRAGKSSSRSVSLVMLNDDDDQEESKANSNNVNPPPENDANTNNNTFHRKSAKNKRSVTFNNNDEREDGDASPNSKSSKSHFHGNNNFSITPKRSSLSPQKQQQFINNHRNTNNNNTYVLSTVTSAMKVKFEDDSSTNDESKYDASSTDIIKVEEDGDHTNSNNEVTAPPPTTTATSEEQDYCEVFVPRTTKQQDNTKNNNISSSSSSAFFSTASSLFEDGIIHSELELMENVDLRSRNGQMVFCATDLIEKNHVIAVEEEEVEDNIEEKVLKYSSVGLLSSASTSSSQSTSTTTTKNSSKKKSNTPKSPNTTADSLLPTMLKSNQVKFKVTFMKPFSTIVTDSLLDHCSGEELEGLLGTCFGSDDDEKNNRDKTNHVNGNQQLKQSSTLFKKYLSNRRTEMKTRKLNCVQRRTRSSSSSSSSSSSDDDAKNAISDDDNYLDMKDSNCMMVSLITGNPSSKSLECLRVLIATCRIAKGDQFVVDPQSVFRCYDDEAWVLQNSASSSAQKEKLFFDATIISGSGDQQHLQTSNNKISQIETLIGNKRRADVKSRSTIPLPKFWPRPYYYHGIGRQFRQELSIVNKGHENNKNNNKNNSSHQVHLAYPFTLLELRKCEALNGELELVAGTDRGVPYGTAFIYGGILAEPRKKAEQRMKNILNCKSNTTTSDNKLKEDAEVKLEENDNNELTSSPPSVDTENFIYSYEAGANKIVLGNSLPRYINHKLNFASSGNVQFVNVILKRKVTYETAKAVGLIANGVIEEESGDNGVGEDTNKAGKRRKRTGSAASKKRSSTASSSSSQQQQQTAALPKSSKIYYSSPAASSSSSSIISTSISTKIIPIFLVVSDVSSKHEALLADSYGAPYDSEMERYIACVGNEPLSAVDAEKVILMQKKNTMMMMSKNNISINNEKHLQVTSGYSAAYRHACDQGSILAKMNKRGDDIDFYFVHSACWGDVRRVRSDDIDENEDQNEEDDDDDDDFDEEEGDSSSAFHSNRLQKYLKLCSTSSSDYSKTTLNCRSNPRFVLAEPLEKIDIKNQVSSKECDEIFDTLKESGTTLYDIKSGDDMKSNNVGRMLYRNTSPKLLQKPLSNSLVTAINNEDMAIKHNNNNSSSNSNTTRNVLLDANSCVLCLPYRDGLWPIDVNISDESSNSDDQKKKISANKSKPTTRVQAIVFTNTQKMLENYRQLWGSNNCVDDIHPDDAAMFSLLRKADFIQPKS